MAKSKETKEEKVEKKRQKNIDRAADKSRSRSSGGTPSNGSRRRKKSSKSRSGVRKLKLFVILIALLILAIIIIKIISYIGGISRVHLKDEGFEHAKRFNSCIRVMGIDVSEFQKDINWKKVKSSEADFAFIRAGFRKMDTGELMEDATFKENIKHANKSGIMVGAYIFSQALTPEEAVEEADYLIDLVSPYDIDMPLVIDYETFADGRLQNAIDAGDFYASSQFHDIVLAFCERVEAAGYESAVYANYSMFTHNMDSRLIQDLTNLWVAQYGGKCDLATSYMFWQCTDSATLSGIEGGVDQDFWYIDPSKVYETRAQGKKTQTSIGECKITFDNRNCKIRNHRAVPKVTVTFEDKKLKAGRDYDVSFVKNTVPGTGYAIVRGVKKYKDWKAVSFTVEK